MEIEVQCQRDILFSSRLHFSLPYPVIQSRAVKWAKGKHGDRGAMAKRHPSFLQLVGNIAQKASNFSLINW